MVSHAQGRPRLMKREGGEDRVLTGAERAQRARQKVARENECLARMVEQLIATVGKSDPLSLRATVNPDHLPVGVHELPEHVEGALAAVERILGPNTEMRVRSDIFAAICAADGD